MGLVKIFLSLLFILIVVGLLAFYWFFPLNDIEFSIGDRNSNFSLPGEGLDTKGQFYSNMRYLNSDITYSITNCSLQKKGEMEQAFDILENKTILRFYLVNFNEELSVTCDPKPRIEEGLFIAGEGGPTNTTKVGEFYVIFNGKVLLLRESDCDKPNIAIHELLHSLGFKHSNNKNNIMYNVSNCNQEIGEDSLKIINELYSIPSYPDLSVNNASAILHKRFLDLNLSIENIGLKNSGSFKVLVYVDNKKIKEIELANTEIGRGWVLSFSNILVLDLNVNEIKIIVEYNGEELDKRNNEIILDVKNS